MSSANMKEMHSMATISCLLRLCSPSHSLLCYQTWKEDLRELKEKYIIEKELATKEAQKKINTKKNYYLPSI